MTAKQFFDWQTAGGANDVVRMIAALENADIAWCAIGGVAVNHWAREPERFEWAINFHGDSAVSMQLSTEDFYRDFPSRAVAADVHGILLRVASLEDTLEGKIKAWSDKNRRQSKQIKDLADIARLVKAHSSLWEKLPPQLKEKVHRPGDN